MKQKDKVQIHTMSVVDLESQIRTLEDQMKKMKMERFTKPTKNVHEITQVKRKIAIMKTVVHEKQQTEVVS
jgi:ribosomal protein L29